MASNLNFSSSQSFTNLLFSQEDNPTPLSPSQPPFSESQTPTALAREPRVRWSVPEEKALASAWLNTSKDSVVGNEQRSAAFWARVAAYYAACPSVSKLTIREANTCKQKWQKMSELVVKFAGCYEFASRTPRSGETEDDILVLAYKLYHQDQKTKFSLEHVWRILKTDQKWCNWCETKLPAKKKAKLSSVEEESLQRPIGVKAAKALAKSKGKGKSDGGADAGSAAELQLLWEVKEKDLAFKERLSKQKLLDSLLGRSDGLSEMEIELKNTLIKEYLSGSNVFVSENEYSGL
ncbi:glutathione S-transferase T3-like isoform X2 [Arabidopsis lyrata subsp. lyrata]|uniref:glutathione S-transferase T3-like isoform X2 n=1 Tax=Arabidopsis lyrata subsp. lyrata TaxID=81972 RepID=UPI000A29C11E|nr:glutathione S-transferase T3-like isoform X2 [Arabidopsis lyrata subsp. lyrata]|eukprot:XP_020870792.1 glutathione S-transferase T3-like isoform X2 [Arabidopsis lyrata subsp. lyrata]